MTGQDEDIGGLIAWAQQRLAASGIAQPRREAWLLMAHATGRDRASWISQNHNKPVQPFEDASFRALVERRAGREPLAYITRAQGFWTLDLGVSDATLIPRADSESLIESLLLLRPDHVRKLRMLDLGTGTGCLLLAALSEYPDALGIGIDLSVQACALAASNAKAAGLADRCAFLCGSWTDPLADKLRCFDVVLSNPPYIPSAAISALMPEVSRFEPHLALDGGCDGLNAYRDILSRLAGLLADDGIAILELGAGQIEQIRPLAAPLGLAIVMERADLNGVVRAVALQLDRPQKGEGQKIFGRRAGHR